MTNLPAVLPTVSIEVKADKNGKAYMASKGRDALKAEFASTALDGFTKGADGLFYMPIAVTETGETIYAKVDLAMSLNGADDAKPRTRKSAPKEAAPAVDFSGLFTK